MSWTEKSTTRLIWVARNQKNNILRILDMTPEQMEAVPKNGESPNFATAFVSIMILSRVEDELRNRGINPATDPRLGQDVLGLFAGVKADMLARGETVLW